MRTVCGSEFQTVGAEKRKARLEKSVLMNSWSSSGMADERKVRLQARSAIRQCRYTVVDVLQTLYVRTGNLYVIRCWTGNQCSWCSNGLTWNRLGAWSTIRAVLILYSLQFLNSAGRCAVKHSVAVVDTGQDQATC